LLTVDDWISFVTPAEQICDMLIALRRYLNAFVDYVLTTGETQKIEVGIKLITVVVILLTNTAHYA